jgi:hypothetical protein
MYPSGPEGGQGKFLCIGGCYRALEKDRKQEKPEQKGDRDNSLFRAFKVQQEKDEQRGAEGQTIITVDAMIYLKPEEIGLGSDPGRQQQQKDEVLSRETRDD